MDTTAIELCFEFKSKATSLYAQQQLLDASLRYVILTNLGNTPVIKLMAAANLMAVNSDATYRIVKHRYGKIPDAYLSREQVTAFFRQPMGTEFTPTA